MTHANVRRYLNDNQLTGPLPATWAKNGNFREM